MTTNSLSLSNTLKRLMFEEQLRSSELSRRTGVPQASLHRILVGTIDKPRQASLEPLANYFNISIEQLKGLEPISWLNPTMPNENGWTKVPLLEWTQFTNDEEEPEENLIYTDTKVGTDAFAMKMKDASMEPLFPQETILVVDPDKTPKDRSYVVAKIENYAELVFRQLIIDGPNYYLKPISPDFERYHMYLMTKNDKIIGVMVQARRNYEN